MNVSNTESIVNVAVQAKVSLLNIYRLESKFEILRLLRTPGVSLPSLIFPVMFYLFFGVLFSMNSAAMPTYLLVTYGTFGVVGPALFAFGVGIAVERGQGWFDLKEVSPMPASAYLIARIAVSLVFSSLIIMLLFLVAAIWGEVRLLQTQWIMLATILLFGSLPFCAFGLALGLYLKSSSAPAVVNLIYLPMAFLSGLWIPITMFPEAMQIFANFLPPYHLAQLGLKIVDMDVGKSIWLHLGVLLAYFAIFLLLAAKAYYKKDKQ